MTLTADALPLLPSHSIRQWKLPAPQARRPVRTRAHGVDRREKKTLTDLAAGEYDVVAALDVVRVAPDVVYQLDLLEVDPLEDRVARDEHAPDVVVHSDVSLGHLLRLLSGLLRRLRLVAAVGLHRVFEEGGFRHCVGVLELGEVVMMMRERRACAATFISII